MKRFRLFSKSAVLIAFFVIAISFPAVQAPAETNECAASFDVQTNVLHIPCLSLDNQSFWFDFNLISGDPVQLQLTNYGTNPGPSCLDDDLQNGIYRICNYFPLAAGDSWTYTTGNRTIVNETRTCTSGYSGIRYGTTSYEYEPFMAVNESGLMFSGCQYDEGVLQDWGIPLVLIPAEMQVGQTVSSSIPPGIFNQNGTTFSTTLVGTQTITVPAGTFNTLKFEISTNDKGECSYKTTLWLGKGIGPVKIQRSDANPASCEGCMFVCVPNGDVARLNAPAELTSAAVNGTAIP